MRTRLSIVNVLCVVLGSWGCFNIKEVAPGDDDDSGDEEETWFDVEDRFVVTTSVPLDVLFVVDNSGAMLEAQTKLSQSIGAFFEQLEFTGVDYHVGLTVLDDWVDQPPIGELYGTPLFIHGSDADPTGTFTDNMTMGTGGWGNCEAGLLASYLALSEPLSNGYNAGFYRTAANLMVVILSNEDDASSDDTECDHPQDYIGYVEFAGWFAALKEDDGFGRVQFVAIVGEQDLGCSGPSGAADPGDGYVDAVELLGDDRATFLDYCEHDWMDPLASLAQGAVPANLAYSLSESPVDGTLRVYLDPGGEGVAQEARVFGDPSNSSPYAFAHDAATNQILFWDVTPPPCGATVRVSYQTL